MPDDAELRIVFQDSTSALTPAGGGAGYSGGGGGYGPPPPPGAMMPYGGGGGGGGGMGPGGSNFALFQQTGRFIFQQIGQFAFQGGPGGPGGGAAPGAPPGSSGATSATFLQVMGKIIGVLGGFGAAIATTTDLLRIQNNYRVAMIRGDKMYAAEVERSSGILGTIGRWGGAIVGGIAGIPGGPVGVGVGAGIGYGVGGAAADAMNGPSQRFLKRWEALAGRTGQMSQYGGPIAEAQSAKDVAKMTRDMAEAQYGGNRLAAFTAAEAEYERVTGVIQAIQRQQEAADATAAIEQETQKANKQLVELLKGVQGDTRDMAVAMLAGMDSPIDQLLKGLELPKDQLPMDEEAVRKLANEMLNRPVFGGN